MSKPTDKISEPTDKISEPTNEISEPTNKMSKPTDKISEPTDKISETTDKISEPTDKISEPTDKIEIKKEGNVITDKVKAELPENSPLKDATNSLKQLSIVSDEPECKNDDSASSDTKEASPPQAIPYDKDKFYEYTTLEEAEAEIRAFRAYDLAHPPSDVECEYEIICNEDMLAVKRSLGKEKRYFIVRYFIRALPSKPTSKGDAGVAEDPVGYDDPSAYDVIEDTPKVDVEAPDVDVEMSESDIDIPVVDIDEAGITVSQVYLNLTNPYENV